MSSLLFVPGVPGGPELIVILLIAVLLFGANKIPKLARSTGQAMGEFQKGRQEVEDELQQMQEGELDTDSEGSTLGDTDAESTTSSADGDSDTETESTSN
ncbi:twin-arginine translocase TatA/TatE family subunit [Halobacteriales archaeon Cl-PHB]